MSKRKVEEFGDILASNDSKKLKHEPNRSFEAMQKSHPLPDSGSSGDESEAGGALLDGGGFKVNEEYAKRFEHNKKREELHRLEEKYRRDQKPSNSQWGDKYDEDEDSSSDEDEDDEGLLITDDLDAQISATLQAIRNKDPRVYDEKVTFYAPIEEESGEAQPTQKVEKPMYLRDYHRENLLNGVSVVEDNDEPTAPRTFAEGQDDLKKSIIKEMHAAADADGDSSGEKEDVEGDGFLVPKAMPPKASQSHVHPSRTSRVEVDVTAADKDPETFLSNFMAARAWVSTDGARFQPLESDDEEEEDRAERFEAAYNLRFEDPQGSNEILRSYARDIIAAKSVRREEPKSRKKQREAEREKKEAEKRQREEERARLRKLKIDEMGEKLQKVKKAAGLSGKTLKVEEWTKFLDEGWNDEDWEAEMKTRFGAEYYAEKDVGSEEGSEDEEATDSRRKKVKKPRWDDDVNINDIIPEFEEEELNENPGFALSDSEQERSTHEEEHLSKKPKFSKERQKEKVARKAAARLERRKVEMLVDNNLHVDHAIQAGASKESSRFRYRETSPTSFGLTPQDILMAPDASLNQFAGLKKMATFRDPEKKRKDKRKLGKKARLREWRRETFGNEEGPKIIVGSSTNGQASAGNGVDPAEGKKKRRSRNKNKDQVRVGA